MSGALRAQHTLVSFLNCISTSPENKYDQELPAELAKHLHSQIIIIIITVINQNVTCTLEWPAQRSVHGDNMTQLCFKKEMCCFTRWKYRGSFVALGWKVTFFFFPKCILSNIFFFSKCIFLTMWVHSVRQGSCWQLGKEKGEIMQTFGSVNVRTTQLYVRSEEFSSLGECRSRKSSDSFP